MRMRILALALGLNAQAACALDYSQTFFFGDSLSDNGAFVGNPDAGAGGRFTVDPGQVWAGDLAARLGGAAVANNPANPRTDPQGNDYAQGGAQVSNPSGVGQTPSPRGALPIVDQVDAHFARHPRADPHALYGLWGGANDVFYQMDQVAGGKDPMAAGADLARSAAALAAQATRIGTAGGGYVLVPNLPDIGATPGMILGVIAATPSNNPAVSTADALAATVGALAQSANDPAAQAAVEAAAIARAETLMALPAGSLAAGVARTQALASQLSATYNQALAAAMAASGANVVPLDVHAFLAEARADPAALGLANVTGTACATRSALPCTRDTLIAPGVDSLFLFADGVHPTPTVHRMIADYAWSVLAAPALVANLAEAPLPILGAHQRRLGRYLAAIQAGGRDGWSPFADAGLGNATLDLGGAGWNADQDRYHLTLGVAGRITDGVYGGAAVERFSSSNDFAGNQGTFDFDGYQASLFVGLRQGIWFARGVVSLGLGLDYDRVQRRIALGDGTRYERGRTGGSLWGLDLSGGAGLWHEGPLTLGPQAGLRYRSVDVDGYQEAGARSTTLGFGGQTQDLWTGELGVFGDLRYQAAQIHLALVREQNWGNDRRDLSAWLATQPGQVFHYHGGDTADGRWRLDLGLDGQATPDIAFLAGAEIARGDRGHTDYQVNLGVRADF